MQSILQLKYICNFDLNSTHYNVHLFLILFSSCCCESDIIPLWDCGGACLKWKLHFELMSFCDYLSAILIILLNIIQFEQYCEIWEWLLQQMFWICSESLLFLKRSLVYPVESKHCSGLNKTIVFLFFISVIFDQADPWEQGRCC